MFHEKASEVIRSIAALCKASAVPKGRGTRKLLENPQPLVETRLDEGVGRGRTVGCCQKWEFELLVSFLKVALEFPLCRGSSQKRAIPLDTTHPTEGLLDGMFARVSEAIVLFDTDDPSHMARCLQLQCRVTSAADCQGVN
jgi:hypothetical protein